MGIDWAARQAAAEARKAAAAAALTDDDRAEQDARELEAKTLAEAAEAEKAKRRLDLERRLDAARAEFGDDAVDGLMVARYPDSFIVKRDGKAYGRFMRAIQNSGTNGGKKVDVADETMNYAIASVYDWNGQTDFEHGRDGVEPLGHLLRMFLQRNPGIATNVASVASKLNGTAAEVRKSDD